MRRVLAALVGLAVVAPVLAASPAYADAPSAPSYVGASGGYRSIEIFVRPPEDDGGSEITGYEYQLRDTGPWRRLPRLTPADGWPGVSYATVRGLPDASSYVPAVRAVNADGVSPPRRAPYDVPSARTYGPPLQSGSTFLYPLDRSLYFVDRTDRSYNGQPNTFRIVIDPVRKGLRTRTTDCKASCNLTGLRNGASYRVSVTALNAYAVGKRTVRFFGERQERGTFVPWDGPQAPLGVTAEPRKQAAALSWRMPDLGYEPPDLDFEVSVDGTWRPVTDVDDSSAVVTGLQDGRTYTLRVRGVGRDGATGLPSAPVNVTPGSPS